MNSVFVDYYILCFEHPFNLKCKGHVDKLFIFKKYATLKNVRIAHRYYLNHYNVNYRIMAVEHSHAHNKVDGGK